MANLNQRTMSRCINQHWKLLLIARVHTYNTTAHYSNTLRLRVDSGVDRGAGANMITFGVHVPARVPVNEATRNQLITPTFISLQMESGCPG